MMTDSPPLRNLSAPVPPALELHRNPAPAGAASEALALKDVSLVYGTDKIETLALDNVHMSVRRGEFVAIEGPSGSGKTTLLSVLGLLDAPSSGSYRFFGEPVERLSRRERARRRSEKIGFIFQDFNLIGDLSVAENVELPLGYARVAARERRERVASALAIVGMTHRAEHFPSQLSGGQQQRVAVARAVVAEPSLLLADEPTGNLDSKNGEAIMDLLLSLHARGTTVCMVSHNPNFSRLAQRVLYLSDGQITKETFVERAAR
jgi:putative ABC transport system ATP-binding protein